MLLIFFIIGLLFLCFGFISANKYHYDYGYDDFKTVGCWIIGGIILFFTVIAGISLTAILVNLERSYGTKIQYIEEHNTEMVSTINIALEQYCEYENKTFTEISANSPEVLFILYPELKANTLFEKYLEEISKNNKMLLNYKLEYANASALKFWLYFGK